MLTTRSAYRFAAVLAVVAGLFMTGGEALAQPLRPATTGPCSWTASNDGENSVESGWTLGVSNSCEISFRAAAECLVDIAGGNASETYVYGDAIDDGTSSATCPGGSALQSEFWQLDNGGGWVTQGSLPASGD
jgi:hypothetical protein